MDVSQPAENQRRFPRTPLTLEVRYAPRQFASDVPPDLWEGATVNVSRSGAALKIFHRLREGGTVELSLLQFDPPRCVHAVGRVVHSSRVNGSDPRSHAETARPLYFTGVEFRNYLAAEDLAWLAGGA